jgi:hypothetical protein
MRTVVFGMLGRGEVKRHTKLVSQRITDELRLRAFGPRRDQAFENAQISAWFGGAPKERSLVASAGIAYDGKDREAPAV